jgi:aldehyde dehydrogenase (NAD+)
VLELGGQCPAIVTSSADVEAAAKDIAWIKYLNSGQICLSVNHVFAHPSIERKLVERMTYWFNEYNKGSKDSMTHIVNDKNYNRLKALVEKTDGKIEYDGESDAKTRKLPPTIVSDVKLTGTLPPLNSWKLVSFLTVHPQTRSFPRNSSGPSVPWSKQPRKKLSSLSTGAPSCIHLHFQI